MKVASGVELKDLAFFKKKILFIHERQREREAETGRGRSGLHPRSPMWDSIPGLQLGSCPEPKADTQSLSHPGNPTVTSLNELWYIHTMYFMTTLKILLKNI